MTGDFEPKSIPNANIYPVSKTTYELAGFKTDDYVRKMQGTAVEVGGPTYDGDKTGFAAYTVLKGIEPQTDLIVSDSYNYSSDPSVTRIIKAENLPFDDNSISILMPSYLPETIVSVKHYLLNLHKAFMAQSYRCLKEGGLLVMQGIIDEDIVWARKLGFKSLRIMEEAINRYNVVILWNAILVKSSTALGDHYIASQYVL